MPTSDPLSRRNRRILIAASMALYGIACLLPSVRLENGTVWPGWQVLLLGFLSPLLGSVAWFGNFVGVIALILLAFGRRWGTLIAAGIAVLIGLNMLDFPGTVIPLDEANVNKTRVASLGPGAWTWLASLAMPGLGLIVLRPSPSDGPDEPNEDTKNR